MKTEIALVNMNTNQIVRLFDTQKSAQRFANLYNDLCGRTVFTTKSKLVK